MNAIVVPRLGWSMEEGIFAGWLKNAGDRVAAGEPLFALESDKVTMEVEALDSGVLDIPANAPETGAVVAVGQTLGFLLVDGEAAHTAPAPTPVATMPVSDGRRPASPRARAMAKSLGIDIARVACPEGSNRIVEADVRRAFEQMAPAAASTPVTAAPVSAKPASRARQILAARLEESFRTPHFYVHDELDVTSLAHLREELLPILEERHNVRLTYNDLLIKAIAMTLRSMPNVNCSWNQGEIVQRNAVNIGLAVQTEESLLVPVIRDADRLSLAQIATARRDLVDRCRRSEVKVSDLEDGSVTLSNLGPFGVDRFQAILNPPQSAIIAAGRIAKRPFVEGDAVMARLTLPLSVSVDHRVIDGVAAARFLAGIVALLRSPLRLILS